MWGSVFYRDMVWLLPLVSSIVIVTCSLRYRQNLMLLVSPGKRCPCPCSDAVLRSCEEALPGIPSPSSSLFLVSVWFRFARGRGGGGGWGPGSIYGAALLGPPSPPHPMVFPPLWFPVVWFPPAPPHCGCGRLPPPPCGPPAPPHCGCGRLRPLPWLLLVGRLASGC